MESTCLMMKTTRLFCALLLVAQAALAQEVRPLTKGQNLYLPIYSHMLYGNVNSKGQTARVLLSAMVSIRNTDSRRPIRILSARYYDTGGRFLREFVPVVQVLPPLGTMELFVDLHDDSGGSGANFLVAWEAAQAVNPPLVEALHANMDSGKAVILSTQAVPVISE